MTQKNKGFTLIELLVVIAIIGILSSVVLASLNNARQKGRDAKRISDVKNIQLALELFFDSNGSYPTSTGIGGLVTAGFLPVSPVDPLGGGYFYTGAATTYNLGADLEDANNGVLDSDADVAGIDGDDTDGCNTAGSGGAAGRFCYDVEP